MGAGDEAGPCEWQRPDRDNRSWRDICSRPRVRSSPRLAGGVGRYFKNRQILKKVCLKMTMSLWRQKSRWRGLLLFLGRLYDNGKQRKSERLNGHMLARSIQVSISNCWPGWKQLIWSIWAKAPLKSAFFTEKHLRCSDFRWYLVQKASVSLPEAFSERVASCLKKLKNDPIFRHNAFYNWKTYAAAFFFGEPKSNKCGKSSSNIVGPEFSM